MSKRYNSVDSPQRRKRFNLLCNPALLDPRIRDIPVRYKDRTYGETNPDRFGAAYDSLGCGAAVLGHPWDFWSASLTRWSNTDPTLISAG